MFHCFGVQGYTVTYPPWRFDIATDSWWLEDFLPIGMQSFKEGSNPDHTVGGRNPAPVDVEIIPLFTGFYTSQVVQDFLHQQ